MQPAGTSAGPGPVVARLRVAVFTNTLVPLTAEGDILAGREFGGVDYGSWALTRALVRLGHEVHVVTTAQGGTLNVQRGGWRVHHVPPSFQVAQTPISLRLASYAKRRLPEVDVVLARMGNQPAPLAALRFAKARSLPLVVSYHGDWTGGYGSLLRRLGVAVQDGWLAGRVLARARAVIALSPSLAASSPHLRPVASKVHVIPNGVEASLLQVREDRQAVRARLGIAATSPVVATMGTLNPIKGLDVLLDAWPHVLKAHPGAVLLVLGDGPGRAGYEAQARRLGIADTVRFLGFIHAGKADLLNAADVFCLPSRSEAFPNALVEAAWLGRPLVASRIPALDSLVAHGRSALLAEPGDSDALAKAIGHILADPELARRLAAAAGAWAQGLSWDAVAQDTARLLAATVQEHRTLPA